MLSSALRLADGMLIFLQNVFGRVVEFAGDQQGSRFLQEKIPTANSDDRQRVFEEIMVDANALMVDVFGNYVIQQLFEHGTMVQKKLLAAKMKDSVVSLSTQLYGCRCVQEVSAHATSGERSSPYTNGSLGSRIHLGRAASRTGPKA